MSIRTRRSSLASVTRSTPTPSAAGSSGTTGTAPHPDSNTTSGGTNPTPSTVGSVGNGGLGLLMEAASAASAATPTLTGEGVQRGNGTSGSSQAPEELEDGDDEVVVVETTQRKPPFYANTPAKQLIILGVFGITGTFGKDCKTGSSKGRSGSIDLGSECKRGATSRARRLMMEVGIG